MVPSLPLLSCESSVSVKKALIEKKKKDWSSYRIWKERKGPCKKDKGNWFWREKKNWKKSNGSNIRK